MHVGALTDREHGTCCGTERYIKGRARPGAKKIPKFKKQNYSNIRASIDASGTGTHQPAKKVPKFKKQDFSKIRSSITKAPPPKPSSWKPPEYDKQDFSAVASKLF